VTVDQVLVFLVGAVVGVLGAVAAMRRPGSGRRSASRPSKRQQEILALLPPDPVRPTIDDLVLEEAQGLGLLGIPGGEGIPLHIRLRVWRRDHDAAPCRSGTWAYQVRTGVAPSAATLEDVTLLCMPGEATP